MQKPYHDQNGRNQLKLIPYLWAKQPKNHTLWGSTYLYSPHKGVPPPPPPLVSRVFSLFTDAKEKRFTCTFFSILLSIILKLNDTYLLQLGCTVFTLTRSHRYLQDLETNFCETISFTLRLNARRRESEIFTEFRLKSSIKPIESIWYFFRNIKRS